MLHNTTREALLQANQGYVALVVDALYSVGWEAFSSFSAQEAITALAAIGTPSKIIRIALKNPVFKPVGRRSAIYKLPTPTSVLEAAGGNPDRRVSDELPSAAFKSLKAYRLALHHALVTRRPGRYLRHLLARRLGVCRSTTRNYDREMHHEVTASYKFIPLTDDMLDILPEAKPQRRKYFLLIKHENKQFFAPLVQQIAAYWRLKGAGVFLVQQMGNVYSQTALTASYVEGAFSDFISH